MPIINYKEYYKPSNPQPKPKAQYYEPPKPKPVSKRQQLPPVFDEFANPYPSPGVEYVKPNVPPIYRNFTPPANSYNGAMYPVVDSYEYPYAMPEPKFNFPKIGAPTDPWGGWKALQNWSSDVVSGVQNTAANTVTSIGRYFQERSKSPFSYTDQQPYKQYLPIVSTPWATQTNSPAMAGANYGQTASPTVTPTTRMTDDRAWQNSRIRTGDAIRPQDYFMRTLLNGIGYSLPNQMLNFTDTGGVSANWAQTPRWYEPPAGYTTDGAAWKESVGKPWGGQDVTDHGTYELIGEQGGGGYGYGGWGGGGGSASYGASSGVNSYLPGTRAGYGANASSPRYTGGGGGRGSSYAGGQYANQGSWRMSMLVWNI